MKITDEKFLNFLKNEPEMSDRLEEMLTKYDKIIECPICQSTNSTIVLNVRMVARCRECGSYTEKKLEDIKDMDYSKIKIENMDLLLEILAAHQD